MYLVCVCVCVRACIHYIYIYVARRSTVHTISNRLTPITKFNHARTKYAILRSGVGTHANCIWVH